jgi:hypothetical protein
MKTPGFEEIVRLYRQTDGARLPEIRTGGIVAAVRAAGWRGARTGLSRWLPLAAAACATAVILAAAVPGMLLGPGHGKDPALSINITGSGSSLLPENGIRNGLRNHDGQGLRYTSRNGKNISVKL